MPGQLKKNAVCPVCGDPLEALVDTSNARVVKREYFHSTAKGKHKRRLRCVREFEDFNLAGNERYNLEVHRTADARLS